MKHLHSTRKNVEERLTPPPLSFYESPSNANSTYFDNDRLANDVTTSGILSVTPNKASFYSALNKSANLLLREASTDIFTSETPILQAQNINKTGKAPRDKLSSISAAEINAHTTAIHAILANNNDDNAMDLSGFESLPDLEANK